ncbi:MAG: hypothetical protein HY423_09140 [Candidatus Lambdaproteobacteria bacterium]|nr:hypothetical protein [Candidatus Lambdaproteobacteria bacterium]
MPAQAGDAARRGLLARAGFGALTLALAALLAWQALAPWHTSGAVPPSSGMPEGTTGPALPPPAEYVVFFRRDLSGAIAWTELARTALARHPDVEFIRAGSLPGVALIDVRGEPRRTLQALRNDPAVKLVQQATPGMICH